jgi:tRNA(His) guanylyltransferase
MVSRDALGERMKQQYELRARPMLPRRTWTVIRIDGRAFHSYTADLDRPFDQQLMDDLAATAEHLAREISGCRLAYAQSDEISLVLTDFATPTSQAWFDGNQQKIVSISASLATARFNELRPGRLALFDSRAFTIPDPVEVANYLVWRQQDATRNSVSMAGRARFDHTELHGLSTDEVQDKLWREHGVNWNDYPARFKRGTIVYPEDRVREVPDRDVGTVQRRVWVTAEAPRFTADREWLAERIGRHP